jgi:hypothetical protein
VDQALLRAAQQGTLNRRNTAAGSTERRAVYAAEYRAREARSQNLGVTYAQARQLRSAYPLSAQARSELQRNHLPVGQSHTQLAIIRAQIARAQMASGKRVSAKRQRSTRAIASLPQNPHPTAALQQWYRRSFGSDYDPRAFAAAGSAYEPTVPRGGGGGGGYEPSPYDVPTGGDSGGGGGGSYASEEEMGGWLDDYAEDMYDIDWGDMYDDDIWDFGEY